MDEYARNELFDIQLAFHLLMNERRGERVMIGKSKKK